jgi:hypothetical protein
MAKTIASTIHLKGERNRDEYTAAGTILPGSLIIKTAATNSFPGTPVSVVVHATAGGKGLRLFALEAFLNKGNATSVAYASGDKVFANSYHKGDVVNAILKATYAYTPATPLVSAGDGTLQPVTALATASQAAAEIIGYPQNSLDLTGVGAVATLHPVEIA